MAEIDVDAVTDHPGHEAGHDVTIRVNERQGFGPRRGRSRRLGRNLDRRRRRLRLGLRPRNGRLRLGPRHRNGRFRFGHSRLRFGRRLDHRRGGWLISRGNGFGRDRLDRRHGLSVGGRGRNLLDHSIDRSRRFDRDGDLFGLGGFDGGVGHDRRFLRQGGQVEKDYRGSSRPARSSPM